MKKVRIKQIANSLMFSIGVCGIDYLIKSGNGNLVKQFGNNKGKMTIYYSLLFIVLFVLCNIVYEKIRKYNSR
ncbi:hypothetical protein [Peptostreptococcus stomatis]|uniref:hypothetical protein n=1 Tax=Peptostreptococcus stomatis TaxID=341694 RepID=UPI0028D87635|nr:hypothetical protein [Peptostreptococcus stomatis]